MVKGPGAGVTGNQLIEFYRDHWKPIFGKPGKVRVDPAGPWRGFGLGKYFSDQQVEWDTIPAEAHWGISLVERAIECTKDIMTKLALEDGNITPEEALSEALRTENEREVVRGSSPAQHALGRAPDENGCFGDTLLGNYPEVLCENPQGEFQHNMDRMRAAEQAHTEFVYDDRIKRAQNSRSYKVQNFMPGDLVFVWRIQTRGPAASARTGGFTGPCRVLATETRLTESGNYRPIYYVVDQRFQVGQGESSPAPSCKRQRREYMELLTAPPDLP